MKRSKGQQALHWPLWKQATAKLKPGRETWTKHEETERRHKIYITALGEDKSLTEMDNDDFDKVKAGLLAIVEPGNLNAEVQAGNGQRKRLLFGPPQACLGRLHRQHRPHHEHGRKARQLRPGTAALARADEVMIALKKHEKRGVAFEPEPELAEHPFERERL
jgi:hypothetical protein